MDRTLELLRLAKEGDQDAKEQIVTENLRLVWAVARRFMGRGHEIEDLYQIGCIGLMKCIDKFDLSYDVIFRLPLQSLSVSYSHNTASE